MLWSHCDIIRPYTDVLSSSKTTSYLATKEQTLCWLSKALVIIYLLNGQYFSAIGVG